jgi:hypothetical protein
VPPGCAKAGEISAARKAAAQMRIRLDMPEL